MENNDTLDFPYLEPELWERSRTLHIVLFVLGTLMLAPAALAVWGAWMMLEFEAANDTSGVLAVITATLGSGLGVFAWTAMGLLLMKRHDARWQRVCWNICAAFGGFNSLACLGWIIALVAENGPDALIMLMIALMLASIVALAGGIHHGRAARDACLRWQRAA